MTSRAPVEQATNGGEDGLVLTAAVIAEVVGGRLIGDPHVRVTGVAPLDRASAGDLSFLAAAKYASLFEFSGAGVVLMAPELSESPGTTTARVVVDRPHEAMLSVLPRLYRAPELTPGVHVTAVVGRGVTIGAGAHVGANVVIGDGVSIGAGAVVEANSTIGAGVAIGAASRVYPNVTLYSGTILGERVVIHAGARIGSDGFGYVFRDGRHDKIPHVGRCVVGADVEIGANTTIDRGSVDDTVIGAGTKIDNLVHVAHNVRIGRLCLLMAQVGIAGSARIEDGVIIAGQAGIAGHVTIGAKARIAGQAGAIGDVPAGETWSGYPARPHKESLRASAALFKLAPYVARIERWFRDQEPDTTE